MECHDLVEEIQQGAITVEGTQEGLIVIVFEVVGMEAIFYLDFTS